MFKTKQMSIDQPEKNGCQLQMCWCLNMFKLLCDIMAYINVVFLAQKQKSKILHTPAFKLSIVLIVIS